jgi:hypothetical protein
MASSCRGIRGAVPGSIQHVRRAQERLCCGSAVPRVQSASLFDRLSGHPLPLPKRDLGHCCSIASAAPSVIAPSLSNTSLPTLPTQTPAPRRPSRHRFAGVSLLQRSGLSPYGADEHKDRRRQQRGAQRARRGDHAAERASPGGQDVHHHLRHRPLEVAQLFKTARGDRSLGRSKRDSCLEENHTVLDSAVGQTTRQSLSKDDEPLGAFQGFSTGHDDGASSRASTVCSAGAHLTALPCLPLRLGCAGRGAPAIWRCLFSHYSTT